MRYTSDDIRLMGVLNPLLLHSTHWENRWQIIWYVQRCESKDWCNSDDVRRSCAQRYISGKRKITPPGTARKKAAAKKLTQFLKNPPTELLNLILEACNSEIGKQVQEGNTKALNSLVGSVLKKYKTDPNAVKILIMQNFGKDLV